MSGDSSIGIGIGLALKSYGRAFRGLLNEYPGAAAAYSLRKLSSSTTNVVRVRRSSDNAEQDFTASQITSGAMLDFVNNSSWTSAENSTSDPYTTFTGASLSGFTATLSTGVAFGGFGGVSGVSGQTVSVSFDVVINSGSPSLALRTSNSVITNRSNFVTLTESGSYTVNLTAIAAFGFIGFSEGDAGSDYTISNFEVTAVSGQDGFVSTWYDQSGNGNDATQSVAASQPKIVDAGVLVSGGIDFDGVDDVLIATGSDISGSYTNFSVETYNGSGSTVVYGRQGSTGRHNRNQFGGNTINAFFGGTTALGVNGDATVQHLSTLYFDVNLANNHKIAYNGSAFSTNGGATAGTQELGEIGLGAEISSVTAYGNSKIAEVIFYESDQSDNRTAIEGNINSHYDIYA